MTDRISPIALAKTAWSSLRVRAVVGTERPDRTARVILAGLPALGFGVSLWLDWLVRDSAALIAGFSLLPAALLAVVPQFAAWRQRLTDRSRKTDGLAQRKLDEAVAHTLLVVVVSIVLAAVAIVLSNITEPTPASPSVVLPWVARVLTGLMVAGGAYLLLSLMLVVNLLFDAYQDATGSGGRSEGQDSRWRDEDAA